MTRNEFLQKLREALSNDLNNQDVQENVSYYDSYITEEVRKGRTEEEVIAEIGDPWVAAQTIISMSEGGCQDESSGYETAKSQKMNRNEHSNAGRSSVHVFGIDSWWKMLLVILGVVGVISLLITIIGGIFSILAPFIIPVLVVLFVVRLVGGGRR